MFSPNKEELRKTESSNEMLTDVDIWSLKMALNAKSICYVLLYEDNFAYFCGMYWMEHD